MVGIPLRLAVPLPLSTNATPGGRLPASAKLGVGDPTVETVKASGAFSAKSVVVGLVNDGGSVEVSVKVLDGVDPPVGAAVAVTAIAPGIRFAVNDGAVATPAAVVTTTADELPPANVPLRTTGRRRECHVVIGDGIVQRIGDRDLQRKAE